MVFFLTKLSLDWLVSNENYGEINEDGLFTAKASGNVIVTARAKDGSGVEAKANVYISDPKDIKVSEIKLSPATLHIGVGDTLAPNVTILPEKAYNKTLSWSIGDTSIASVDTNGNVTGLKEGVTRAECVENIDIGGPTMLRSAAKNYQDVTVITDPQDSLWSSNISGTERYWNRCCHIPRDHASRSVRGRASGG